MIICLKGICYGQVTACSLGTFAAFVWNNLTYYPDCNPIETVSTEQKLIRTRHCDLGGFMVPFVVSIQDYPG